MKIVVTLESGRVMVSNLDLDGNALLYELKSNREPNYNIQNCDIYVNSFNAYIGEMTQLIKHERPSINIARDVFNHLTDSEYTYVEQNGRKWNATLLTALVIKRLISKIEETVTKRISEVSFCVHPSLQNAQVQRELKTALGYYKLNMGVLYNHSSAVLNNYARRNDLDGKHFVISYFDSECYYLQIIYCDEGKYLQKAFKSGDTCSLRKCHAAIFDIINAKCTHLLGYEPKQTPKNNLIIEGLVDDVYRAFFIREVADLNKPVFIDSKPCLLKFEASDFSYYKNEVQDFLNMELIKCLDDAEISYEAIDKIFIGGEYASAMIVHRSVSKLFDSWIDNTLADDFMISKGAAYLLHGEKDAYKITPFKRKTIVEDTGVFSNIKLKVESAEEYIVFDSIAASNYTSLTVNLSEYEEELSDTDEIVFEHYIIENNQRKDIGEIHILHDVDIYPAQLQLNIIRKDQKFNSIQAIDFENDQILAVNYIHMDQLTNDQTGQKVVQDEAVVVGSGPIKIKPKLSVKIKKKGVAIKPKIKVKGDVAVAEEVPKAKIQIMAEKPKLKIKPISNKKIKIEINNDEIKDKFQEILEIIMINNSK